MIKTTQITTPVFPVGVISSSNNVVNPGILLKQRDLALALTEMGSTESNCKLPPHSFIILDFGKEYPGGLRLIVKSLEGSPDDHAKLRIRFGESAGEACSEIGEQGQVWAHTVRDFNIDVPSLCDTVFGNSGFRFVRIDNIDEKTSVYLQNVLLSYSHIDTPQQGYFRCEDEEINRIYETSVRSAYLCCQNDYLYEAIKRDRLIWAGDMGVEIRALLENYGPISNIPNSLNFCRDNYRLPSWMNGIPSYSFWWLMSVALYYRYTKDIEFLKASLPVIEGTLKKTDQAVSREGELDFGEGGYFIDWPTYGAPDGKAGTVGLVKLALEEISAILKEAKLDNGVAEKILQRLRKLPMSDEAFKSHLCLQQLAWEEDKSNLILKDGGQRMSTFMSYFIFMALAKANRREEAVKLMKEYYGDMLRVGATTFFEDYQMDWGKDDPIDALPREGKRYLHADNGKHCYIGYRLSLCHGWAAGPAPFLLEEVAGLQLLDEHTVKVHPHPGSLKHIEAAIATQYGPVKIVIDGKDFRLSTPKEITIVRD